MAAIEAKGHKPGKAATCTEPQICEDCGTVLELPKGHSYNAKVYPPSCSAMGYTEYVCKDCGDTYTGDYVDRIAHKYHKDVTIDNSDCKYFLLMLLFII